MKRTLAALAASAIVLSACGDDGGEPAQPASATTEVAAQFNDADVTFVEGMIPHHRQAVEMADKAASRAGSDPVRELASRISQAQGPEIETMEGWLDEWGVEPARDEGSDMAGMDHGSDEGMAGGMMSEDDMASLDGASGTAFDEMFLSMMIEHHEGAVEMARTEIEQGRDSDAVALAERIVEAQEAEIAEMEGLLEPGS